MNVLIKAFTNLNNENKQKNLPMSFSLEKLS